MLVCDAPVAVHLAQANRQPEEEIAVCIRAAPHNGGSEGNIFTSRNGKFFYVERLCWLVIFEEQIPRFLILIHSPRLQRWRNVEHHNVLLMVGKNAGKVMPAHGVCTASPNL